MKKLVCLAAIAVMSLTAVNAQEVSFGVKGGVNFATYNGDNLGDIKSRTGVHVGGLVELPIADRFSIQPELLYSAQGGEYRTEGTQMGVKYTETYTTEADYISLPVMAKLYLLDGLALEAGPQVSFLVSSKEKYKLKTDNLTVENKDDVNDFSNVDFSLGAGASYKLPMGLFFGARYNFGLTNVLDDDNAGKIHNNVFQLSAGYSF